MPLLDPAIIAEGGKPPQILPPLAIAEQANRAALLRQQVEQAPLRTRQLDLENQTSALALQQKQEDVQDGQTIQNVLGANVKDDGTTDWDKSIADLTGKIRPRNLKAIQDQHLSYLRGKAEGTTVQRQNTALRNQAIANAVQSLLALPEAQRAGVYPGLRQSLIDQKFIDPADPEYPETPPDLSDQTLKAHLAHVGALAAWDKEAAEQAQAKERSNLAKKYATQADVAARQDKINQAVTAHLGVSNQEQHSEWLENLDPDIKPVFENFKTFDPDTPQGQRTAELIQEAALTPNQRTTAQINKQKADALTKRAATTPGALAALASDPTQTDEVRKSAADALALEQKSRAGASTATANQRMIQARDDEREAKLQKELQAKEADLWTLKAQYKNRIQKAAAAGQDTIKDPKSGRDMPVEDATSLMNAIDGRAKILNDQQQEILKRHGWGKYTPATPAQASPSSPATAPAGKPAATATSAPPTSMLKEGVATKFKNGQTWTLQSGQPVRLDQPSQ